MRRWTGGWIDGWMHAQTNNWRIIDMVVLQECAQISSQPQSRLDLQTHVLNSATAGVAYSFSDVMRKRLGVGAG